MNNTELGKVSVTPKGEWSSSQPYAFLDIVTANGGSYIAKQNVPAGTAITSTAYWLLIAEKGDQGDKGDTGDTGETGATGNGIASIEKTGTSGNVDTYTITFTDDTTTTFTVTNGAVTSVNGKTGAVTGVANVDGYYGNSGGVFQYSTNFIGKNSPQNASNIVFRPTASQMSGQSWSADSISGQTATIEKIKGKTLVWNQLVDTNTTSVTVPNGHKYRFYDKDGTDSIMTSNGTAFAVTGGDDMVIDLTKMYGSGREPQTVDEFKAQFPLDYYAYNAGELISLNATGLKTTGFNQFNKNTATIGKYMSTNGEIEFSDGACSDYIKVFPNTQYYLKNVMGWDFSNAVIYYDSEKNVIGGKSLANGTVTSGTVTTPTNCAYMIVNIYNYSTYLDSCCVNIAWSGIRNGEYEPYWNSELSLPIATYFEDGMKSAGTVYDELTKDKATKRIGVVDLGSLDWTVRQFTGYGYRFRAFDGAIPNAKPSDGYNTLCVRYNPHVNSNVAVDDTDLYIIIDGNKNVWVNDHAYTDAATFKTAMSGVYLYYELAEPVETSIVPAHNLTYRCDDSGTEMELPQNDDEPVTAQMDADITYQIDYEANVRNMPQNVVTKISFDNFIAAYNFSGIGHITQTWNPETKSYDYTVVKYVEVE